MGSEMCIRDSGRTMEDDMKEARQWQHRAFQWGMLKVFLLLGLGLTVAACSWRGTGTRRRLSCSGHGLEAEPPLLPLPPTLWRRRDWITR